MYQNIAIIGSSGAIGNALLSQLGASHPHANIYAFSRELTKNLPCNAKHVCIDYAQEQSIADAVAIATQDGPLDLVIVAIGVLHDSKRTPEKSLRDLSADNFEHLFRINAIVPALLAKHFIPKLQKRDKAIFAVLSARVGSISDNRLGGWYAYRASKAALNMIIKNLAIEVGRLQQQTIVVGLHPGTVDSQLSRPFQKHLKPEQLFTSEDAAARLLMVINNLTPQDSGKCWAWDGELILP